MKQMCCKKVAFLDAHNKPGSCDPSYGGSLGLTGLKYDAPLSSGSMLKSTGVEPALLALGHAQLVAALVLATVAGVELLLAAAAETT